jgi:hypothetical protein
MSFALRPDRYSDQTYDTPGAEMTPLDTGIAFVQAFGRGDRAALAALVAPDITFESPRVRLRGAEPYLAAVTEFAQVVDSLTLIASFGDDGAAMIMYDMHTGPFGTIRGVDYLTIPDGLIEAHALVFDTYPVRTA